MSIVNSDHAIVRSEDTRELRPNARPAPEASAIGSTIENVPNYRPRRVAARRAALPEVGALQPFRPRPVIGVARASFGTLSQMEVVIGDDDRTPVPDALESPWRHICALRIRSQSGTEYVGTGWFIGPNTVMTAGHCVYLHRDGGWAASISVIPALSGNVQPYGALSSNKFRATEAWTTRQDTNFDYGAIQLDRDDLGAATGWFSFAVLDDPDLVVKDANISGYPNDLDQATRQYFHARKISKVSPSKIFYEIDTYGGQSGSPIWFNLGSGQRVAIGVHTTGSSTSNSGTRITNEVFANMTEFVEETRYKPTVREKNAPGRRGGKAARA